LKAKYETGSLSNIFILRRLEKLKELELIKKASASGIEDEGMVDFNKTFYKVLPNLKVYTCDEEDDFSFLGENQAILSDFKNLSPCALEQCEVEMEKTAEQEV